MAATPDKAASPPDPSGIMALSTGYWGSQALITANRLGVFDVLEGGARTAVEVADELGLEERMTELFLNALAALGLLEKSAGRYANSRVSQIFLTSASAASMRDSLRFMDDLYATWGDLENALRSGKPAKAAETYLGGDEAQTRHFVRSMHDRALAIGRGLVEVVDTGGRQRLLDVGGGPGTFSALLTERNSELTADVLELDGVATVAEQILAETGAAERVRMIRGDYHTSDFGSGYDMVLMSGMFHRETPKNCRKLIRKAAACLEPGGLLVVTDVFTDPGGTAPEFSALFGITMMLTAPDGCVHADADVAAWMDDAGFAEVEQRPFPPPMPHRVVVGKKA